MSETISGKNTNCDRGALDQFLNDKLAEEQRLALEEHLSDCLECRTQLEHLAAESAMWADTQEFLSSTDDFSEPGRLRPGQFAPGETGTSDSSRHLSEAALTEQVLSFLSPTDDPRMLGRFGGYEVAGVIGCGGMGIVLKALDVALNRYVAIKVLSPHLATSAAARQRFAREARAAAAVVHENVTAIHSVAEANGLPYLVMPYIRGSSLQKRLDTQGALSTAEVLRIGMQAAAALAAAHAQGLVHRDIKPANILLEDGVERLTITDFGLARAADDASLTRSGVIAGTPQFMSPEQARGEPVDARSDLFSLGSVLYALCTGRAPFRAETAYGVLRRISDDVPRPVGELNPEIPDWLVSIVGRLHAKRPAERYQSAEEVSQVFAQCLAHVQQPLVVALPAGLTPKRSIQPGANRRRRLGWSVAVLLIGAVVAGLAYLAHRRPAGSGSAEQDRAGSGRALSAPAAGDSISTDWIDGTEKQLSATAAEIEALDASADVDWGDGQ